MNYLYAWLIVWILVLVWAFWDAFHPHDDIGERIGKSLAIFCCVTLLVFLLGGLGLIGLVSIGEGFADKTERVRSTTTISSLRGNDNISGSFFLGTGTIEQTEYYLTFVKVGKDSYQRYKIKAADAIIVEDGDTSPHVDHMLTVYTSKFLTRLTGNKEVAEDEGKVRIHVPKNTIIKEFKLK